MKKKKTLKERREKEEGVCVEAKDSSLFACVLLAFELGRSRLQTPIRENNKKDTTPWRSRIMKARFFPLFFRQDSHIVYVHITNSGGLALWFSKHAFPKTNALCIPEKKEWLGKKR